MQGRWMAILAALAMLTWGVGTTAATTLGDEGPVDASRLDTVKPHLSALGQQGLDDPIGANEKARELAEALHEPAPTQVGEHLRIALEGAHDVDADADLAPPASLAEELRLAWLAEGAPLRAAQVDGDVGADAPPAVADALAWIVKGTREADAVRPDVAGQLTDAALATLAEDAVPGQPYDPADGERAQLLGEGPPTDLLEHEHATSTVDLDRALAAHAIMAEATEQAVQRLQAADLAAPTAPASQTGDVLEQPTPYGPIVVSGLGDHTYTEDALVTVDLGGDDTYDNRAGATEADVLGLAGTSPPPQPTSPTFDDWAEDTRERIHDSHNVSLAIDVSGQDRYVHPGPGTQGYGGFGGFGALVDLGGDDVYQAAVLGQGAGRLAGAGLLVDASGQDTFSVLRQGQGYSQDAGAGLLVSGTGNDVYKAEILAQGTGFVGGLLGGLVDGTGSDHYGCTGVADFRSVVLPVSLSRPGSTCQGTGFGGTGLLADGTGDDTYRVANSFRAMALLGTGVHVDGGGQDVFDAAEWSNGIGALGTSILVAEGSAGDTVVSDQTTGQWVDIYVGSNGEGYVGTGVLATGTGDDVVESYVDKSLFLPQYACGAGCTYQGGTGLALDAGGDDLYRSEVGQGGAVGGTAALLDAGGNDTYRRLYDSVRVQGYAQPGADIGAIGVTSCNYGLLHDAQGADSYDNPITTYGQRADGENWGQNDYGRGLDGTDGTTGYATGQGLADLQEIVDRQACQQVVGLP